MLSLGLTLAKGLPDSESMIGSTLDVVCSGGKVWPGLPNPPLKCPMPLEHAADKSYLIVRVSRQMCSPEACVRALICLRGRTKMLCAWRDKESPSQSIFSRVHLLSLPA